MPIVRQSTLYLIWREPESRAQHKVGELAFDGLGYTFTNDRAGFERARGRGFSPLPGFADPDKVYRSYGLFPAIAHRLPDPRRPDYDDILARFGSKRGDSEFEILRKTRGRLGTDEMTFEEAPRQRADGNVYSCHVAGWRFYQGEEILRELAPGSTVRLVREPANQHDANAVAVYSESGRKLGYVPAYVSELTAEAISREGEIRATIEEIKPPPNPSNERMKIRVST